MDSRLTLSREEPSRTREGHRPFAFRRPIAALGVWVASWAIGCALANDTKDDSKAGLQTGGPVTGCVMTAKIDCPLRCSDIDFDAVCDATLGANCDGHCGAEATGTCLDDCSADCAIGCAAQADVDCKKTCWDRCNGNCKKLCAGSLNPEQCNATCGGECNSTCAEECGATSDSSCDGTCKASCSATCSVEAHVACELRCSVDGFTTCKAKAAAQCVAECSSAVMLTCSDPSAPTPDEVPSAATGAGANDNAKRVPRAWAPGLKDEVAVQRGLATSAPTEEIEPPPPPVDAPPLGEHPLHRDTPQDTADASVESAPPPPSEE
jgi:hypothetical protein